MGWADFQGERTEVRVAGGSRVKGRVGGDVRLTELGDQSLDHVAVDVGQPEVAAVVTVGQLFVIETKQV